MLAMVMQPMMMRAPLRKPEDHASRVRLCGVVGFCTTSRISTSASNADCGIPVSIVFESKGARLEGGEEKEEASALESESKDVSRDHGATVVQLNVGISVELVSCCSLVKVIELEPFDSFQRNLLELDDGLDKLSEFAGERN